VRLDNADHALVDPDKLRSYLLSPTHPIGRFKAAFFYSLGFRQEEWHRLDEALREHVLSGEAQRGVTSEYGDKFIVRGILNGPFRSASVVSIWFVRVDEKVPRFVTAYPGD